MTQGALSQLPEVKLELHVKLVSSYGDEVFFKTKCTTKLSMMKAAYAHKVGKDVSSIRLLYHDAWIGEDDTPESLHMEDNGRDFQKISLLRTHHSLTDFFNKTIL
jgi:hypothetical protein